MIAARRASRLGTIPNGLSKKWPAEIVRSDASKAIVPSTLIARARRPYSQLRLNAHHFA